MARLRDFYANIPQFVEPFLEYTPFLDEMPFENARPQPLRDTRRIDEIDGPFTFVELNAPAPQVRFKSKIVETFLKKVELLLKISKDELAVLGQTVNQYFDSTIEQILPNLGLLLEEFFLTRIAEFAIENGAVLDAGGTGDNLNHIVISRYGSTMTGLLPSGKDWKSFVKWEKLSNGALVNIEYENGEFIPGYQGTLSIYSNIRLYGDYTAAVVVNADKNHLPTASQLEELMAKTRYQRQTNQMRIVFPSELGVSLRNSLFSGIQQTYSVNEKNEGINQQVLTFQGVKLVSVYSVKLNSKKHVTV